MILENERARLIPFNHRSAQLLRDIIFDDTIWQYMGHYIRTEKDFTNYVDQTMKAQQAKT